MVPRTCREIGEHDTREESESRRKPLEEWGDAAAYVLLGPPGAGKTTVFTHEAARTGGTCVTARDFLIFDEPEWHKKTLFIDGLDETRAGTIDGRTPLDGIRAKLDRMGRPRFRLSCREADWFGANDRDHLKTVSPDATVTVLHLEPLSREAVRQILSENHGIDDLEKFIASAQNKGLEGLLANPQSLKMLAEAVGSGGIWPRTRMEAFDMACRTLLEEHNEDHRIAQPDSSGVSSRMDAGGRLCAIQLLSGAAGYSLSGSDSDMHFPGFDQVPKQDRATLRSCLQSKLFETSTQRRVAPVHRQIAEFLAARYLAGLVENGLPVGRILALVTGHDGVVVSELRGLSAWLGAHSKSSRTEVIACDPLGTVLYGDASRFSPDEKRSLLDGLQQEASANPRFIATLRLDSRLGDLVSSEMEEDYRKILADPSREDAWQSFIVILIEALRYGERLPGLAGPLMRLLRDDTWWPRIRFRAIQAFLRHHRDDEGASAEIKALTADVYAGKVPDPDDALLGHLLSILYPATISETEIMQYLRLPRRPNQRPEYQYFWTGHLPRKSTRDQLAVLLDEFTERNGPLLAEGRPYGLPVFFLRRLPLKLLERFLRLSGDEVDLTRLFRWLETAADAGDWTNNPNFGQTESQGIRQWLESRPDAWKTLLTMGLKGCVERSECDKSLVLSHCMYTEVRFRLLGAARSPDFGLWCIEQALLTQDTNAIKWLLGEAAACLHYRRYDEGLSRKVVSRHLDGCGALREVFDKRMAEYELVASDRGVSERSDQDQQRAERPDWHEDVKLYESELRENRASPALLHELAVVYFGGYLDIQGNSPKERLNSILADDVDLVDAVLSGFRKTSERDDLPSDRQVLRLGTSNRTHPLALPFMAGLEEITSTAPSGEIDIDERLFRLALAIHYTVRMWPSARHAEDRPLPWYGWLLSRRPGVVADVLVRSVLSKLRGGVESPAGLHELARSPDHAHVARVASIPLLKQFPVRCKSSQLSSLNHALLAARRHCDTEQLLALIDKKHAHRSMNVAQRVHWLVAGLCIAPETYVVRLETYVSARERRIRFLAEAVARQFDLSSGLQCRQSESASHLLIRLIGGSCRPYSLDSESSKPIMGTLKMDAADRVRGFIEELAAISTKSASSALEALSSDNTLHSWRSLLMDAAYRQKALRREAEFVYGDITQILDTLDGGAPANAADLAALTLEHLHQIAHDIREGNTSGWRQYWNVDHHNRPQTPRPEDACRDTLLSALRDRSMQLGIDVQPEGRYANDRRADIRVSSTGFNIPVEIKRSCHRDLWSAIRSQLIASYTRDPGAEGHGIYLVFWFGDTEGCLPTLPATGPPPVSPRELEERLVSTLSAEERRKIGIRVIDVSIPSTG